MEMTAYEHKAPYRIDLVTTDREQATAFDPTGGFFSIIPMGVAA